MPGDQLINEGYVSNLWHIVANEVEAETKNGCYQGLENKEWTDLALIRVLMIVSGANLYCYY